VRELTGDDQVIVAPGGPISVDGMIVTGRGYVQETSMTGEWRPASRGPGDPVFAGTFSIDGSFEIRPGTGPRRLDAVLDAVAGARLAPSRLQRQADRLVAWFLPSVVAVSTATFAGWMLCGPWERALFNAMAVLLVACPCAAGLATPVAVWGGLARLASFGLVARTGDFLDALAQCDVVCLDKTGTLSTDVLAVGAWRVKPAFRGRARWLGSAVAAAEEGLAHPVAAALRGQVEDGMGRSGGDDSAVHASSAALDRGGGSTPVPADPARERAASEKPTAARCQLLADIAAKVRERRIVPGQGVVAVVEDEAGRPVEICVGEWTLGETESGRREAVNGKSGERTLGAGAHGVDGRNAGSVAMPEGTAGAPDPPAEGSAKSVFVFVAGAHAATIELQETWREGLAAALQELKALDVEAAILTGDPSLSAGRFPGVILRTGMTPADKHRYVQELVACGRDVVFVGDGVNDAAAMSAAQASIAMQAGADLAHAAAMAVFTGSDLRFLPQAISVARATRRSIRLNLRFAATYNLAGMALAAAGLLHPVVAALLMVGSSAFVSVNALRAAGRRVRT